MARGLCAATVISHTAQLHHPAAAKQPNIHNITRGRESTGTCAEAEVLVVINLYLSFGIGELAGVQRGFHFYLTSMLYRLSACTEQHVWITTWPKPGLEILKGTGNFFKDLLTDF